MKKKIIFIVCPGRSGSTVFSKFINTHSKVFSLCEPHYFDKKIKEEEEDKYCSCEKTYTQCNFWKNVISQIEKQTQEIQKFNTSKVAFVNANKILTIIKYLNLYFYYWIGFPYMFRNYFYQIKNEACLLKTISELKSEEYLVDASKNYVRALFLEKYLKNEFSFHYIILMRDPRSNVYSQLKKDALVRFDDQTVKMKRIPKSNIQAAIKEWKKITINYLNLNKIFNTQADLVLYEDFTQNPKMIFQKLSLNLAWENQMLNLNSAEHHLLGGNTSRITAKKIFKAKEEWKKFNKSELQLIMKETQIVYDKFKKTLS
ncbi:sulfotransferase [Saccharicrinis sp. FJH62]|uniref:sulfotransferase n=1 Tax=Saccharicrinis sp. FJH62 TaxID=3344657 RepID=UPI0035D4408B